jgi:hypothetical protein
MRIQRSLFQDFSSYPEKLNIVKFVIDYGTPKIDDKVFVFSRNHVIFRGLLYCLEIALHYQNIKYLKQVKKGVKSELEANSSLNLA